MKRFYILLAIGLLTKGFSQENISTKNGIILFEASIPYFEEIKAKNEAVSCRLNIKNGEINSLALMKEFRFKLDLMTEHFNKNYIESNQYPKAKFKGKIIGFNWNIIGNQNKEFKLIGNLELHGITKKIEAVAQLKKIDNQLEIITNFDINAFDFNIVIPKIISNKIAKTISIKTFFLLK